MHAKPDLRVFLEWMIAGSGSVITDVITPMHNLTKFEQLSFAAVVLVICGVFLQLAWAMPALGNFTQTEDDRLLVRGWPYVAEIYLKTGGESHPVPENHFLQKQFRLNLIGTCGLVLLSFLGTVATLTPIESGSAIGGKLALFVSLTVALSYTSGVLSPNFLRTGIPLGFWFPELTITARPPMQKVVLVIMITLVTYGLLSTATTAVGYVLPNRPA
jgi:hypothetical protein